MSRQLDIYLAEHLTSYDWLKTENPRRINIATILTSEGGWFLRNSINFSIISSILHHFHNPFHKSRYWILKDRFIGLKTQCCIQSEAFIKMLNFDCFRDV
jgi:hypothetical protein